MRSKWRALVTAALVTALVATFFVALVGCSGRFNQPPTGGVRNVNTVVLRNKRFIPQRLTVATGSTVTFRNLDSVPHHIVVGRDDLGEQQPKESKTWTAPRAGAYEMKCLIHPSMTGQITVSASGTATGTAPGEGGSSGGSQGGASGGPSGGY